MKAIILSAGMGTRLMSLTKNTPKALLEIGSGFTLVETQLLRLAESGCIDEVVFVIGYRAEQIEAKLSGYDKIPVRFIYNPFYDISNNLVSLWFAAPEMNDDFILINGDNIFKSKLIQSLVSVGKDKEIVKVIHRKKDGFLRKEFDEDDMKVVTVGDMVVKVSKKISSREANGEAIGINRFIGRGRRVLSKKLNEMVRKEENKDVFYLAAIQGIMDEGFPVYHLECEKTDWAEVDFHPDLQHAQKALEAKLRHVNK